MHIIHSFLETERLYSVWVTDVDSLRGGWLIICVYPRAFKFFSTLQFLPYNSVSQTFFKWGPLSLVRMFYGPPYSWDYETH